MKVKARKIVLRAFLIAKVNQKTCILLKKAVDENQWQCYNIQVVDKNC